MNRDPSILKGLYKSAAFVLQAKHFGVTGQYLRRQGTFSLPFRRRTGASWKSPRPQKEGFGRRGAGTAVGEAVPLGGALIRKGHDLSMKKTGLGMKSQPGFCHERRYSSIKVNRWMALPSRSTSSFHMEAGEPICRPLPVQSLVDYIGFQGLTVGSGGAAPGIPLPFKVPVPAWAYGLFQRGFLLFLSGYFSGPKLSRGQRVKWAWP